MPSMLKNETNHLTNRKRKKKEQSKNKRINMEKKIQPLKIHSYSKLQSNQIEQGLDGLDIISV